jgi:hypothetical protein
VIDESKRQNAKHPEERSSTLLGIKIDLRDENANAPESILIKCEFNSNVIDEIDSQFEKQFGPRISTFTGIKIDLSDE